MRVKQSPVDWRECQFVSIANAARIAGREPGWAREAIAAGHLEAVRLPTGGPAVVTVASLRLFLDAAREAAPVHQGERGPSLRVVASNP
ncbi:hypothetical protein [Roseivivax marinus]|nr:hypothetical protein [Roseivivax marinus]